MYSLTLTTARQSLYANQIRVQSTMIVPSAMRMAMLSGVALEDEESEIVEVEENEDDTLSTVSSVRIKDLASPLISARDKSWEFGSAQVRSLRLAIQ